MTRGEHIVSLKQEWAHLTSCGLKRAELRRRPMRRIKKGDRVWIYRAGRTADYEGYEPGIIGYASVGEIETAPRREAAMPLDELRMTPPQVDRYLLGVEDDDEITIIRWADFQEPVHPATGEIVFVAPPANFRPPQFYMAFKPPPAGKYFFLTNWTAA